MRGELFACVVLLLIACGEGPCPIGDLPPCDDERFLTVTDPLPEGALEGEGMVTAVAADSVTVALDGESVVLPLAGAIDVSVGDVLTLVNPPGSAGIELLRGGRFVGFVGRLASHQAPEPWVVEVNTLELELEPVCIRDTGSRSWCDGGDAPSTLVYAVRVGGVVVPPGESRTGSLGEGMATVRNRGINAPLDCDESCTPVSSAQLGLDIAVQP